MVATGTKEASGRCSPKAIATAIVRASARARAKMTIGRVSLCREVSAGNGNGAGRDFRPRTNQKIKVTVIQRADPIPQASACPHT